jgi:hypothetical protein
MYKYIYIIYLLCNPYIYIIIWLVVSTNLKNMKVSWEYEIPNIWKVIKAMFQTNNQNK